MYKFVISIQLKPGSLECILKRAPVVQRLTRSEAGCIAYDFFTCTDDPDRLIFIECFQSRAAHAHHCDQQYTRDFIAFHEQFHESFKFELLGTADAHA